MPLRLQIVSDQRNSLGPNHLKEFVGCGGTIGRSLDNDWALPDANRYLSSRHAMVDCQGSTFYLIDTSRNGVFLNGSDMPIGKGNPHKLKDGDKLRMGDYEFEVGLVIDERVNEEDTMTDSIVRAQLVEEDKSMEVPLLNEENLEDMTLADHLQLSDESGEVSAISETNNHTIATAGREAVLNEAIGILMKAAGIDAPEEMSARNAEDMLDQAGALIREYTAGLTGLNMSRSDFVEKYQPQGSDEHHNLKNPLQLVTGIKESLSFLLSANMGKSMGPEEAVREVFRDLAYHQRALIKAISGALDGYIGQFDPEEIERVFAEDSAKTGNFLEQYAKAYDKLTANGGSELPAPFNDEFVRAYAEELRSLQSDKSRQT